MQTRVAFTLSGSRSSSLLHPLVAHRLVLTGVRLGLRAVQGHMASFTSPAFRHSFST